MGDLRDCITPVHLFNSFLGAPDDLGQRLKKDIHLVCEILHDHTFDCVICRAQLVHNRSVLYCAQVSDAVKAKIIQQRVYHNSSNPHDLQLFIRGASFL